MVVGSGSQILRIVGARQMGDGAVFGRHRHPVVGLGHHRVLAGDGIAHHGKAVGRADQERVEAIEILQAVLQRFLQALHPPRSFQVM